MTATLLGLDLGTSTFKASAYRVTGEQLGTIAVPTPWRSASSGAEMEAGDFADAVRALVDECASAHGQGRVAAIGVTGMAETVFTELSDGRLLPARAWNQQHGRQPQLPDGDVFAATGLLDPARTPAVELRRVSEAGETVRSWNGVPELAVQVLGGAAIAERSLAARTGLIDVRTGDWSPALLGWAGLDASTTPDLLPAGEVCGIASIPAPCAGAALTVAGHDHVVAALGAGAYGDANVFDSLGTGEALIAQLDRNPDGVDLPMVDRFKAAGFNVGLGLEEQDLIALAGLGTGNRFNLLLTSLSECGFSREEVMSAEGGRCSDTQRATQQLPSHVADLLETLFGARWQDLRTAGAATSVIRDAILDLPSARALWWAAVSRASRNARSSLDALAELLPGATLRVAAGGWLNNAGIRAVRQRVLGPFDVPAVSQCGTRGAALLAGLAAGLYPSRADFPILASTPGATQ